MKILVLAIPIFSCTTCLVIRTQKLLLSPNNQQANLFRGSAGLSRFAWNWAVKFCRRHYAIFGNRGGKYKRPTAYSLINFWNKIKARRFPWFSHYSKFIPEESFKNFNKSMQAAFKKLDKKQKFWLPRLHKKSGNESFNVIPSSHFPIRINGNRIFIPRIGMVRFETPLRWPGVSQVYGQVKLRAGRWWLTLSYDLPDPPKLPVNRPSCGIDLGCKVLATIVSGGEVVEEVAPLKPFAKAKRKIKRFCRVVSRRENGSKRRERAKLKVAKAYERVANLRSNQLHQLSSRVVKRFGVIVLEDLNVKGMAGGMLAGTIADLGFGEFRRQIEYKSGMTGTKVVLADRFYPSSKSCSRCGEIKDDLSLSDRVFHCAGCNLKIGRDHNAGINLEKLGQSMPEVTRGESGSSSTRKSRGAARRTANAQH